MSKRIVLCCDGTNNEVAGYATNVLRLYRMLMRDENQLAYYDSGVGTIPYEDHVTSFGRSVSRLLDGAMGLTIRLHFLKAYRFLVQNYEPGDELFLFGFSRGSYTARAVAGAIHMFGILRPELDELCELVWATYSGESPGSEGVKRFQGAQVMKKSFARPAEVDPKDSERSRKPIRFLGLWDSVSAFGVIWDQRTLPYTDRIPCVDHVRHAMAIDEHRAMFQALPLRPEANDHETFKQVWFAGVHSDVGGGYPDGHTCLNGQIVQEGTLSKVSLEWMLREATQFGLTIDCEMKKHLMNDPDKHPPADPNGVQHESLEGRWRFLEYLPQRRYRYRKPGSDVDPGNTSGLAWYWPNLGRHRKIEITESASGKYALRPCLHESVLVRAQDPDKYCPPNLPTKGQFDIES